MPEASESPPVPVSSISPPPVPPPTWWGKLDPSLKSFAGVLPGYTRVYGHGDTANGWVMYPSDKVQQTFPSYVRVPDAGGWAFAPSYGVFAPA